MKKIIKNCLILQILIIIVTVFISSGCTTVQNITQEHRVSYDINATFDDKNYTLTGSVAVDYTHSGENTLTYIAMHLYANAYQNQGGVIEIEGVYVDQKQVGFSLKGEDNVILCIPLSKELYPDEKVEIAINYTLRVPQIEGRFGASGDTVRLSGWYPQLCPIVGGEWQESEVYGIGDYFYSDVADYTVRLTVNEDIVVASSCKRMSTTSGNGTVTHTYEGEAVRDFAMSLSDKYEVVSAVYGSTLISCYAFSEEEGERLLPYAQKSFALYSEKYGRYPYPVYSVALCETQSGGMEFSGIVYVSRDLEGLELETVVAHETAHQWWYGVVGSDPTTCAWLDEGLAEYSTMEYLESVYGKVEREKRVKERDRAYTAFCSVLKTTKGKADLPMTMPLSDFASEYEYVAVTYYKGELFFESLSAILGKKLDDGLKRYYTSFHKGLATPDSLADSFREVANINFGPIFDAWESGKVYFGA